MLAKLKAYWPVIALLVISLILCLQNYTLGTFLSGWDTLHPEFNFNLNLIRTITGVFRIEQGLGAVAGHSHMADLPRIVLLYIVHFILPQDFIRYFYIFLNIVVGTLGMYFLLNKHFLKQKTASFIGALFYLLNVGTVQTFNVPFEMFTTLFATLPFLFLFATSYILEKENRTRNLFLFAFSVIFTSPSAYAAVLWYVFFFCFLIYFFSLSLINLKHDKKSLKRFFILCLTVLGLNLFWIIPNIYFVLNHATEVAHANINRLFSDQAFLKNKEFGNISDILLLKSFYFDWNIYQGKDTFTDLLLPWIQHFKDIKVLILGYGFGISFILGGIYAFKKVKLQVIPILLVLGFSLFFLFNDNFPVSFIFNLFRDHVPFFKEALRFPDDKILNVYVFLVSILLGFSSLFIVEKIKKINIRFEAIFAVIAGLLIVFYSLPSFTGNFINKYMRVDIPKQYFQLFDYLNNEPSTARVANLPIQSPYGWVYYNWYDDKPSFQGAGFLYFGIKQPLLDRDFDRWSPYNESYYREMSYAIYKQDKTLLINVINKYKIGFIFIDKNVISPQSPKDILYFDESKKLIEQAGIVEERKTFGNIEIFKLRQDESLISALNTNINVNPTTTTTYHDYANSLYTNYITTAPSSELSNVFFPFRDLIDNQSKLHANILSLDNEKIVLNPLKKVDNFQTGDLSNNFNLIPADIVLQKNNNLIDVSFYPNTPVFDQTPSTSSIKGVVDVGNSSRKLTLAINQNSIFSLTEIPENTPLAIGKILLKNSANEIDFFDNQIVTPIEKTSEAIVPFFSNCDQIEKAPRASITNSSMKLTGAGNLCLLIPYGFFPSNLGDNQTILTNFQFNMTGNAKISSCLFSQETSSCLYYKNPERLGSLVSFTYALKSNEVNKKAIKIFFESGSKEERNYDLTNFYSSYSKSIASVNISADLIKSIFLKQNAVSFSKISLSKNIIYDPGFDITKLNKLTNDCGSSLSKANKTLLQKDGKAVIEYNSTLGSFCDHFSYQDLPHNQGYLIVIESKHESGLPLTLCITNYTSRKCDVYADLSANKTFGKDVLLLPPQDEAGIGYDINFDNLGINKSPSVNYVSSIEIIPIPYEFLENIQTQTQSKNNFAGKIEKIEQYNPLLYLATTNGKKTVVSLSLSYENGFKAYSISCSNSLSCAIKANLAPFFGKEIKNHVLVDNWANGWITDSHQVVILFLPQYLETLGFILILIIFSTLLYHILHRKEV